jgi:hypothetical protein
MGTTFIVDKGPTISSPEVSESSIEPREDVSGSIGE